MRSLIRGGRLRDPDVQHFERIDSVLGSAALLDIHVREPIEGVRSKP
jgi:hypothetical protein